MPASRATSSIVKSLKRLHPEQFENLTYDILFLSGVQNLRWRTPSADGGRDLEGEVSTVDFEKIMLELTKLSQATYAAAEFGQNSLDRIALIAAFTELISTRVEDSRKHGRFAIHPFKPDRDSFEWCKPNPLPAAHFDGTS